MCHGRREPDSTWLRTEKSVLDGAVRVELTAGKQHELADCVLAHGGLLVA